MRASIVLFLFLVFATLSSFSNPEKPITVKLYKGTEVRGRLLLPDGESAAGVLLNAGVCYFGSPWVSNNRMRVSYSIDWPNWSATTTTEEDGSFSVTVPPANARNWIRLGTTRGGFRAIDTAVLSRRDKNHPLVRFAPFSLDINGQESTLQVDETSGIVDLGDLRLSRGIVFRGRVVNADGQPLSEVHLFTSSKHGPFAGRKTISQADGSFEFMPMNAGTFQLKKVPTPITNLKIALHPDQRVTPSYQDDSIEIATGQVPLSNFKLSMNRVIYGDEPFNRSQAR